MNDEDFKPNLKRLSGVYTSFTQDTVVKRQSRYRAQLEYEKTKQGGLIGQDAELFRVPKITDFDSVSGSISFERLYGIRSLAEALSSSLNPEKVIMNVAYSLASIHNSPSIFNDKTTMLSLDCVSQQEPIFIHGDYSTMNLCLDDKDDLVILDWSTATWVGGAGNESGPCYLDLSIFVFSLFFHRPFEAYQIKNPDELVPILIDSYCSKYQHKFELKEFQRYFPKLIDVFLHSPKRLREKIRVFSCLSSVFKVKRCIRKL